MLPAGVEGNSAFSRSPGAAVVGAVDEDRRVAVQPQVVGEEKGGVADEELQPPRHGVRVDAGGVMAGGREQPRQRDLRADAVAVRAGVPHHGDLAAGHRAVRRRVEVTRRKFGIKRVHRAFLLLLRLRRAGGSWSSRRRTFRLLPVD